jgi:hypothetical protein
MNKTILIFALWNSLSTAFASEVPPYWVQGDKVHYLGVPEAQVHLMIYKESSDSWAYLQVDVDYPDTFKGQLNALKKAIPGMQYERILGVGVGLPKITICGLGISSEELGWIPRPNGPAVTASFILTKQQTESVLAGLDLKIKVQGTVQVQLSEISVVEERKLPNQTCESLFENGNSMQNVLIQFASVSRKINQLATRFEDTKKTLKQSVLRNCIDFSGNQPITSFSDLLKSNLSAKTGKSEIKGQTVRTSPKTLRIDFKAIYPKNPTVVTGN